MGFYYDKVVRPFFFRMEPERAHALVGEGLKILSALGPLCRFLRHWNRVDDRARPVELFGLRFPNLVGLAAGFDKDARFWPALLALGFGHVEVGTVTARRQPGNPRPRVFRYPGEKALINRMGFNNDGASKVAKRLKRQFRHGRPPAPLGINLGKSKATTLDHAAGDYLESFDLLSPFADYFAINVSSPNTPGLRALQQDGRLPLLLGTLKEANERRVSMGKGSRIPLLLKIAPDLTFPEIDFVLEKLEEYCFDGIIATNTTLARPGFFSRVQEEGGLSGPPLRDVSTKIINYISRSTSGRLPIIGVGGIDDPASAAEKLDAGASLVQIYTGMIFKGPFIGRDVARGLRSRQETGL